MSAAVGSVGAGQVVQLPARDPAPVPRPVAPSAVSLPATDDQAFEVSTINQRLATLAAARRGGVDITA